MEATMQPVIHIDPAIMGGVPVFTGTRVPVSIFWDYLEGAYSLDEFLAQYPTVRREQALGLLEQARKGTSGDARAA